jgi:hypothetical protein
VRFQVETHREEYEYVDLGLSVKWATCNVGASKPEEYGDYFAWGETKQTTGWYKWYKSYGSYEVTKYCTGSDFGAVDNKTLLEAADDAATANWGGAWRMPTKTEQDELREHCTWTWTQVNGVKGYKVTSKRNGNFIFLPAAGYCGYDSIKEAGSRGYYWSSSLGKDYSDRAYYLGFRSSRVSWYYSMRSHKQSVRPVSP